MKDCEGWETQPYELVTVNVYVPGGMVGTVYEDPAPVLEKPPGSLVSIHVPDSGNSPILTLPVEMEQDGLVMVKM